MARIRTIKPEMWQDEKLAPLSPIDRLVFIGLISMADDDGRMLDNCKAIDGFIFPESGDSSRESIENLARIGRVLRYTSTSGQKLLQIVHWAKHQKVDNKAKYTLPAPTAQDVAGQGVKPKRSRVSRDPSEDQSTISRSDLRPTTYDPRPTTIDQGSTISDQRPASAASEREENHVAKSVDDEFEREVWPLYPKREGSNSKHDALKAYRARRAAKVAFEVIRDGTDRYRRYCVIRDMIGTSFVKQASTFFGPGEHYLETWEVSDTTSGNGRGRQSAAEITRANMAKLIGGAA